MLSHGPHYPILDLRPESPPPSETGVFMHPHGVVNLPCRPLLGGWVPRNKESAVNDYRL